MSLRIFIILLIYLGVFHGSFTSAETTKRKIVLLASEFPSLVDRSGKNVYINSLTQGLSQSAKPYEVEVRYLSPKRALLQFLEGDGDCLIGRLKTNLSGIRKQIVHKKYQANLLFSLDESTDLNNTLSGQIIVEIPENEQKEGKKSYILNAFKLPMFGSESSSDEVDNSLNDMLINVPNVIVCAESADLEQFSEVVHQYMPWNQVADEVRESVESKGRNERVLYLKQLLVDILPPPLFVIEAHLASTQLLIELGEQTPNKESIKAILNEAGKLKGEEQGKYGLGTFDSRWNRWKDKGLSQVVKTFAERYFKAAGDTGRKYLTIQSSELFPAVEAGDFKQAQSLYKEKLSPLYKNHREQIEELIFEITKTLRDPRVDVKVAILLNDFLMDIYPPPSYIVEPYFLAQRMFLESTGTDWSNQEKLGLFHQVLEGRTDGSSIGFQETQKKWEGIFKKELRDEKFIKNLFTQAQRSGTNYFDKFNHEFMPAFKQRNRKKMRAVLREISKVFGEHRRLIRETVIVTKNRVDRLNRTSAAQLKN